MKAPTNWKKTFIKALEQTGNVLAAAKVAGVSHALPYRYRHKDTKFAAAWAQAVERSADLLELEARRRAIREGSDTLLIFLLKALRPSVYRENRPQNPGAPIDVALLRTLVSIARGQSDGAPGGTPPAHPG
jgi:hypothetical protein